METMARRAPSAGMLRHLKDLNETPEGKAKLWQMDTVVMDVRKAFLERAAQSPQYYDQCDVIKVRDNDFTVRRFVLYNESFKDALQQLDETMKWRKSYGVNRLDFTQCSTELFKTGGMFIYNDDREGRPVLYIRVKAYIKVPKFEHIIQEVTVNMLNKMDSDADALGMGLFMDFTGAGLKNADISLAKFVLTVSRKYFPESIGYILLFNFPKILAVFLPVVRLILGEKYSNKLKLVNGDEIFEYIDRENVPKYLGGNCVKDFTIPPPECTRNAYEFADEFHLTNEEISKFLKVYEPIMKESESLVKK